MSSDADLLDLLGRDPDEQLLDEAAARLPAGVGRPEPAAGESRLRRQVVALGAALTGVTLLLGLALAGLAIAEAVSGAALAAAIMLVLAILLVGTHWGWVHVAELAGNRIQARHEAPVLARRRAWLAALEPYPRWEVSTSAQEDGSIAIVTRCYRPTPSGERAFTFVCEQVACEIHPAEQPAAIVAERAEVLRRQARAETERARERFQAARDAYEQTLLAGDDERQRRMALRAASHALSERLNAHLREPPLIE